jgi:hypothetical protein
MFGLKTKPTLETLHESVMSAPARIDTEAGVIHGVRVLGKVSQNGREYTDAAMTQALPLYEGVKVNVDHVRGTGKTERNFAEGVGELRNVRRESDAVYADLHYLKSHPLAPLLVESAERFPKQFGLSHDAEGKVVRSRGKSMVESVVAVHSVDLVGRPATNAGLFESIGDERKTMKTTIRSLVESASNAIHKTRLLEMDGTAAEVMAAPVEVEADSDGDGQIDAAFKSMVMGVLDNEGLDVKGKLARIRDILNAQEKLLKGEKSKSETGESSPAEAAMAESLNALNGTLKGIQLRESCRDLLAEAGVTPTTDRMNTLVAAADDATRKKLVEAMPRGVAADPRKPAVMLRESSAAPVKYVPGKLVETVKRR